MLNLFGAKAVIKHTHHPITHHPHRTNHPKIYHHVPSLHIALLSTPAAPKPSPLQYFVPHNPSPTRTTADLATAASTKKITARTIAIETISGNDDSRAGKADTSLCLAGPTKGHESGVLKIDTRQAETGRGTYCLTGSRWIWEIHNGSDELRNSSWREVVDC